MAVSTIKNYRWIVATMLFFATTINYLDRQVIGLLKPILEKEFKWTETDFAHIVMAFTAAYAIGLLAFGWLIDKIGSKVGYAITVIWWSVAAMLHAIAKSAFGFGIARAGLGLGESGNYPAAMKTVAEWFPKKERALATGFFNAGTSVGVVTALFIVPFILRRFSWQDVFWITGVSGFAWLIFWWWFYELPAKQKRLSQAELQYIQDGNVHANGSNFTQSVQWKKLFLFKQTWALIAGKGLIDPIYWFFLYWLPSYFFTTYHMDLRTPSLQLMIIYIATTIGSIGGGYLSSLLVRRGWPLVKARKKILMIMAILELSILFVQFVKGPWLAVAFLSLAVAAHQAWATNVFTMASDMFPAEAVSSVVGIAGMAGAVGGILFPIFVGSILDSYKAAGDLAGGYNFLFTACGCTYLITWILIHFLTRKVERVDLRKIS